MQPLRFAIAGATEEHLVQKAVRLAGAAADGFAAGDPRLAPRDDAAFHLADDAVGDFLVNIHFVLLSSCGEHSNVVE